MAGSAVLRTNLGEAVGFYSIITAATLLGIGIDLSPLDPIKALFRSAVINGFVAVPVMAAGPSHARPGLGDDGRYGSRRAGARLAAGRQLSFGLWCFRKQPYPRVMLTALTSHALPFRAPEAIAGVATLA